MRRVRLAILGVACVGLSLAVASRAQKAPELRPKALQEMVETERAFAAMGAEKGVNESFYKYFGEEGIGFGPHPEKFREAYRKNPPPNPAPPLEFKLEWWPAYGDMAESGDLGWNTGPTLTTDRTSQNRPSRHGYFFSVWRKMPAGNWEVAVDMGIGTPGPDPAAQDRLKYTRVPQEKYKAIKPKDAASGKAELMALEAKFAEATKQSAREGYAKFIGPNTRIHRPGRFPIIGPDALMKNIEETKLAILDWAGIDGQVAKSGELGFVYGRFEIKSTREGTERQLKGYYTHVWKRDAAGNWKLAAEVINPLPPNAPPAPSGE